MVHALQRAGRRLRPGGLLISLRPHRTWRPAVAITAPGYRLPITRLVNPAFDRNLRSADAALQRVVDEGWFTAAGARSSRFRIFLQRPSQMRTYLELINPPRPRFPRGGRARLHELWKSAARGSRIEVTEYLVIDVLRRRPWRG
jgi:hypothetical protein